MSEREHVHETSDEDLATEVWEDESPIAVSDIDPEAVVDELPEEPTAEEFGGAEFGGEG